MALTATGVALLPSARALLTQADELRRQAAGLCGSEPVRLGYVNWRPPDLVERTAGIVQLLVDAWVLDHVRRLRRPVVNSPKGQTTPVPPDLIARPLVHPVPCWTWSLVVRHDDTRSSVQAVVKALTHDIGTLGLNDDTVWLPANDPHKPAR